MQYRVFPEGNEVYEHIDLSQSPYRGQGYGQ